MKKLFSFLTVIALLLSINFNYVFSQDEQFRQEPAPKDEVRTPQVKIISVGKQTANLNAPFINNPNGSSIDAVSGYSFAQSSGTYTPLVSETTLWSGTFDDNNSVAITIPSFTFDGTAYTTMFVQANGWITLGGTSIASSYTPISQTTSYPAVISAFGRDLNNAASGSPKISYNTNDGGEIVIQYQDVRRYNIAGEILSFQIRLNPTTGRIKVIYGGTITGGVSTSYPQVGLRGATNADFNNRTTTTNWSATTAGTLNTSTCLYSSSVLPPSGLTFEWYLQSMAYSSSAVIQATTAPVLRNTTNNPVIVVAVTMSGSISPLTLTQLNLNTTGTTNPLGDIENAKVFFTGNSASFSTATPFGSVVPSPNGSFNVSGTQELLGNVNYFWITYDVKAGANLGNTIDGECTQLTIAGTDYIPSPTAPAGSRIIKDPLSGTYTIDNTNPTAGLNYNNFTDALADLNTLGLGGPVTFNVSAGQTWNKTVPAAPYNYAYGIFTTGTVTNTITFQKSGGGENPILNILGTSATNDMGIWIYGDYTTFNGIDVNDAGTTSADYLETGLYLQGPADDNCKYVTVKNSTVDLNKTNTSSKGVYLFSNAPTSVANANNYNKFYNNTIQDAYSAYYFSGNSTYLDDGNEIGIDGGTSLINNIGDNLSTIVYAIYAPYETNFKLFNTTISNVTASTTIYCFYDGLGATSTHQIYNNTFTNVTGTSSTIYGLYNTSGTTCNIYNNIFKTFTAASTVYPIYITAVTTSNIYNNKIYDIAYSGTSTSIAYGLHIGGGTNHYIYNNFIYDIKAPNATSSTTNANVRGLSLTGGTNAYVYYNTVFLDYTSAGATNQSAALYVGTTPTLDLRNNIFVNNVNATTGTRAVAFYKTTTSLTNFATTSNNNLYFSGVLDGTAKNLIFYDATNSEQTLAGYKTRMATRDQNAATENPPFVSAVAPYDLKIQTTIATQVESGGQRVTTPIAVTTDFENDIRWGETGYAGTGTAPDIGADEFNGIPIDINGPTITYTPLVNTTSTGNRVFSNVTITDPSGVNVDAGTAPRVYFKKSTDANTYAGNTDTDDGWKWVETTSGATPFSFTLDYTLILGGGVAAGEIIQYFVIAQDVVGTPNVSINSGTPAKAPTSVDLTDQEFPLTGTINQYSITGAITGVVLVGTGQTYTSLTANDASGLFKAINEKIVTGNLTVKITSDLTETGAVALNQTTEEAIYTITIQPNDATLKTISGSYAGGLIRLNGADGITFDGRFEGSGNYLTFNNTSTAGSAVFQLISLGTNLGATNNTIRNCNISAGSITATTYGIFIGSATLGTAADDNDNNSILNNLITKCYNGIWARSAGTVAGLLNNLTITGNTIGSNTATDYVIFRGVDVQGAVSPIISQNEIFNLQTTGSLNIAAIDLGQYVTDANVSRNKIYGLRSTSSSGWGAYGINISSSTGTSGIIISNNLIYDIITANYSTTSTTYNGFGIRITGGTGHKVYYNSVNLYGTVSSGSSAGMSAAFLVTINSVTGLDLRNNIFANSTAFATAGSKSYTMYVPSGTTFGTINYNDYYASGTYGILGFFAADVTTLADWKTATGQDVNSIDGNPSFVANIDLQPAVGSPVLTAGTPVSITVDYTGVARSGTAPSIGAYENPFLPILPPNCANIVSPANSGTNISTAATLNWADGGGGTTGYKLSFGTNNPPSNILNDYDLGNVTTYDPPADLEFSTTYYWKVTAYNGNGDATGCNIWSFTTQSNPNFGGGTAGTGLYFFANSTANSTGPSKPTFNWVDYSTHSVVTTYTSGTGDDGYFTIPDIGFDFLYFGNTYRTNNVHIYSNGAVTFGTAPASTSNYGHSIPDITGTVHNIIAGLWQDLDMRTASYANTEIRYGGDANQFVITFVKAHHYTSGNTSTNYITFQIILIPQLTGNGDVKLQYNYDLSTPAYTDLDVGYIGIENSDGTAGIGYRNAGVGGPIFDNNVIIDGPNAIGSLALQSGMTEGALPVTLSSFTNTVNNRDVKLNWVTASEINNAGFDIEKSGAGINQWVKAGYVSGKGTISTPTTYTFEDKKLNTGKYNYRLKQIDQNGNFTYYNLSSVVEVGLPTKYELSQNYPNPFNPVTKIDFSLPFDSKVSIKLYDITGREVKTLVNDARTAGYYTVQFNASDLSSGTYFYRIMTKSSSADYIMTKKMVLIK